MPKSSARQIPTGKLKGYGVRLGLYQVILVFEVDEEESIIWIDGNVNNTTYQETG